MPTSCTVQKNTNSCCANNAQLAAVPPWLYLLTLIWTAALNVSLCRTCLRRGTLCLRWDSPFSSATLSTREWSRRFSRALASSSRLLLLSSLRLFLSSLLLFRLRSTTIWRMFLWTWMAISSSSKTSSSSASWLATAASEMLRKRWLAQCMLRFAPNLYFGQKDTICFQCNKKEDSAAFSNHCWV